MLAPTHLIAGQAAYLAACLAAGHGPAMPEAWAAALCGLLPDLDKRNGIIGRLFPYLSEPLEFRFGHRTLTHSLLFALVLGALLWPLLPFGWWLAVVAGWASHGIIDMMTPQGVAWFWPSRVRCVLPGNERYRMEPMSWGEFAFAVLTGLLAFAFLALGQAGEGTGGLIRSAIGDIAAARHQYDAEKGQHAWTARLQGRDNRSYADVSGAYPVIGPWGEAGFLLEDGEATRSVCKSSSCDWYADHAVLVRGDPEITTTTSMQAKAVASASLIEALAPLDSIGKVYLLGTLTARGIRPEPPTVAVSGDTVTLTYASPAVLQSWPRETLRDVALVVQVRHAPGVEVPAMAVRGGPNGAIPPALQKWIE